MATAANHPTNQRLQKISIVGPRQNGKNLKYIDGVRWNCCIKGTTNSLFVLLSATSIDFVT
jgi:hypothetical protein